MPRNNPYRFVICEKHVTATKRHCRETFNSKTNSISRCNTSGALRYMHPKTTRLSKCYCIFVILINIVTCQCHEIASGQIRRWKYENTGIVGSFDECAAECEKRSGSLSCIENDEQNKLFFEETDVMLRGLDSIKNLEQQNPKKTGITGKEQDVRVIIPCWLNNHTI